MMELADDGILVGLVVCDAVACLDFYQDTLGMKQVFTEPMDEGGTKYYLKFDGGYLRLFAPDEAPVPNPLDNVSHTGFNLLTFMVKNIEAMNQLFDDNGVKVISPLQTTESGVQWMIVADPEGNRVELAQSG